MTFFWYDYETFGPNPRRDRPAQFAGIRTNEDLEVIEDPLVLYCRPSPDYLPDPESCLIHGISPVALLEKGMRASDFASAINEALSAPDTCGVGYNAVNFDHEVTRFLFYRNLIDPYAWHWRDGCSRWDVIDLLRATYALRPDGITWARRDDGAPSFKLEDVARANGIIHESAHDAASDVEATVAVAALVKKAQPALFDYYLGLRHKRQAEPFLKGPCLFVSGRIDAKDGCATLVAPICKHPGPGRGTIVYDLRYDPDDFVGLSAEELRRLLFTARKDLPEDVHPPRLYEIKANACPFVADPRVVDQDVQRRLGLDVDKCRRHFEKLKSMQPSFAPTVSAAYVKSWPDRDVDEALYKRLTPSDDRAILERLRSEGNWNGATLEHRYVDERLPELVYRFRARNYAEQLGPEDGARWKSYCRDKHFAPGGQGRSRLEEFDGTISRLRDENSENSDVLTVLDQLIMYGDEMRRWLAV